MTSQQGEEPTITIESCKGSTLVGSSLPGKFNWYHSKSLPLDKSPIRSSTLVESTNIGLGGKWLCSDKHSSLLGNGIKCVRKKALMYRHPIEYDVKAVMEWYYGSRILRNLIFHFLKRWKKKFRLKLALASKIDFRRNIIWWRHHFFNYKLEANVIKKFRHNLRKRQISWSVCNLRAFPDYFNICRENQKATPEVSTFLA